MFSTTKRKPSRATAPDEELGAALERLRRRVDLRLGELLRIEAEDTLARAVHAAVATPGKRLRPVLVLLIAEVLGREADGLLDVACAVELVHAASLALDDLPCMDDSPVRRGQPSLHVRFGEATAILAAFDLLAKAQAVLSKGLASAGVAPAHREELAIRFADVVEALCRGQLADLDLASSEADLERLESIHARKTGSLFELAARLGCACADASPRRVRAVLAFARNLGLAFQVEDDLLDAQGSPEETGKPSRDAALGRTTFVSVFGAEGARAIAGELTSAAVEALAPLGPRARILQELAEHVRSRSR